MIKKVDIRLSILNKSAEDAKVIERALSPDNLTTPPMRISSETNNAKIEIKIENIHNIDTAIATVNDLLDAYTLSTNVLERIEGES